MKPGIYRGLSFDEYKAIPAWNPSLVLSGRVSMLQLDYDRKHPKEVSPQMRFGGALHCSILEPDLFPLKYCLWSGGRRAGNKYIAFQDANEGKEILKEEDYEACLAIRDSIYAHPIAGELLKSGNKDDREVSVVWKNYDTLLCKGRIDLLLPDMIVELKTTRARVYDNRKLVNIASSMGYHIKLAAYQDGISHTTDETLPVKIIFAEQLPPHDVRVMNVPAAVLAQGWDEWQRLLLLIAECEQTGIWPGCDSGEGELHVWGENSEYMPVTIDGELV